MSWGQAAEGAGKAGESGSSATSLYGSMADTGGSASGAAQPTSGFSMPSEGANAGQGPTVDAGNMQTYGTTDPSYLQQGVNGLERFQKGGNQGLGETYKNFGNNPETYGAAYGLVNKMAGSGKPTSAAPITTHISYQQPAAQKRGRY